MAGLYIHVPFCAKRCTYCDFFSQTETRYKNAFVQAVVRELELRKNYLDGEIIETIYFGGGTPSQLQSAEFKPIFKAIYQNYDISSDIEVTLETNPDDISDEYLSSLQTLPFNRISIGIQSFRNEDLQMLNRRHDRQQAIDAVILCQKKGYTNLSVDLIYGLPGQTLERWEENLNIAFQMNTPHLSAYHLSYEEGTLIHRQMNQGAIQPVDEDVSVLLFEALINKFKTNGYLHYEISNFCKPGYFSRHNTAYWTDRKYIGIGPAAHSYNRNSRQWNIASLPDYIESVVSGNPLIEKEIIDDKIRYNDYIMTRLRTMWGIQMSVFSETFGQKQVDYFLQQAKPYIQSGLLLIKDANIMISPKGFFISDGIICNLMKS